MENKTNKKIVWANELPGRNKDLVKDYLAKKSDGTYKFAMVDLIVKYRVSHGRIYQLLKKAGVKRA